MKTLAEANAEIQRLSQVLAETQKELAQSKADIEAANVAHETAQKEQSEKIESLGLELKSEREALAQSNTDIATARQTISTLTSKIEKLEGEAKTADQKAAKICASVGVPPVAVSSSAEANAQSGQDILAQYRAIKDPAQSLAFYRKNEAQLIAADKAEKKRK